MRFALLRITALLLLAGAVQAAVYKCDNNGRPAYTQDPGPGCVPMEIDAPQPSREEVQRETQRWTLKQEEERVRQEEAAKAREDQAAKARERQLQNMQRELELRRNADQAPQQGLPLPSDSTVDEGSYLQ